MTTKHSRTLQPQLTAGLVQQEGSLSLVAPIVGHWRNGPLPGERIAAGSSLGEIEILGVLHHLVAPAGARGIVQAPNDDPRTAPVPVQFGQQLVALATSHVDDDAGSADQATDSSASGGLMFRSPLSGRFYIRPSPDKPEFVKPGDEIERGRTVALLEVMKTFNRITYGAPELPDRVRVRAVIPGDEQDVEVGDPLLEVEPI